MNAIYLDNNATSPMLPAVWEAMLPYLCEQPGNPASSHSFGRAARRALEDARERIAGLLDASPSEVVFTSGATEANNLAIFGLLFGVAPGAIASCLIEHPCVVEPIRRHVEQGFSLHSLPVSRHGEIDVGACEFPEDLRLAAVMLANHETGALQPVAELVERLADRAPFHCDAAAAAGKMPISFRRLGVSTLTISGHKFHGPKGVGALIVNRCTQLRPLFFGGQQQGGKRPGTEPVALAVGMATALEWSVSQFETNRAQVCHLRTLFLEHLRAQAGPVILNGPETGGLPHALNLSFPGCRADALLMKLDLAGVACSTGSACSSGSLLPSPVLTAMGLHGDFLNSAMRFSLSSLLTSEEVAEAARRVADCVQKLRLQADPSSELD